MNLIERESLPLFQLLLSVTSTLLEEALAKQQNTVHENMKTMERNGNGTMEIIRNKFLSKNNFQVSKNKQKLFQKKRRKGSRELSDKVPFPSYLKTGHLVRISARNAN